jgi:DNA invertase Pin-like site-specific DNA recombinase
MSTVFDTITEPKIFAIAHRQRISVTLLRGGAQALGDRNGAAALTEEQAEMIRQRKASGGRYWGRAEIAAELGVHWTTVQRAANGKTHAAAIRARKKP